MINVYSIDEIIDASESILTNQVVKKKIIIDKDPILDKNNKINETPMGIDKKNLIDQLIPQEINKLPEQPYIKNEVSLEDLNVIKNELVESMYLTFSKKIKKNTLKLIVELRNDIIKLDKKIIFFKDQEIKFSKNNKLLRQDIRDLVNKENKLKYISKKKDLDLNSLNLKLDRQQNEINDLKDENKNLNLKLDAFKNQNSEIKINNKFLEQENSKSKSNIQTYQIQTNQLTKDNNEVHLKIQNYQKKNDLLEKEYSELKLKIDELKEFKQYKFKFLEYKQKNFDLEATLDKLKVNDDKNILNIDIINELKEKIKFYQEENVRISNELTETKKKLEVLKSEIDRFQDQRSNLIEKMNSVNSVIQDSNIVTSVFVENNNNDKTKIHDSEKNINKEKVDINLAIGKIFSKL